MYFLKQKHMKKRKSIKIFWVRKFYHENEKKKKEDFRNVVMATTIAVVYVIPYYSQVYRHKGVQGAQFSKP